MIQFILDWRQRTSNVLMGPQLNSQAYRGQLWALWTAPNFRVPGTVSGEQKAPQYHESFLRNPFLLEGAWGVCSQSRALVGGWRE